MADKPSDQAKILALFDHITETAAASSSPDDARIADQLAILLAVRFFNRDGRDATCEALAIHLKMSIDRTIAAANSLAQNGYVEAFTTSIDTACGTRSAIAFRIPCAERAFHFLDQGA